MLAPGPEDPELARVVAAWPSLPPHIRQIIATLITTMAPGIASDATDAADVRLNAGHHRDYMHLQRFGPPERIRRISPGNPNDRPPNALDTGVIDSA